ncbi:MAG: HAD family hydrolase [Salinivirgaceae bacterium]|jgi:phosphoglycolate phosphatase
MLYKKPHFELILWDWNGTLLNDQIICIDAMNRLLVKRGLPLLTEEKYRRVFTFPVKTYYAQLGFDFTKEPFEIPALEFMEQYHRLLPQAGLFPDAIPVLHKLKELGYRQLILSAMEQESLIAAVKNLHVFDYFEQIAGIQDQYAHGKVNRAKELFLQKQISPQNTLLIGDTLHDVEVANELGCQCLLVATGHQSAERLQINGNPVVKNLRQALEWVIKFKKS